MQSQSLHSVAPRVVDFHNHFIDPSFPLSPRWRTSIPALSRPESLVDSLDAAGLHARVVSAPPEFLDGEIRPELNDAIAAIVARHPDRLFGLATVDAYGGEAAAKELMRAVRNLGLRGVFMESAHDGLLPDAPEARPTLLAAAELGVPVFLHPVPDPQLRARFQACGKLCERLSRGTINSAAILALLECGMLDPSRKLRVVVTALALGGLLLAGKAAAQSGQIYIDTTGFEPATLRASIGLLGAQHVVLGTDWPVVSDPSLAGRVRQALTPDEQPRVLGENALRLLGAS